MVNMRLSGWLQGYVSNQAKVFNETIASGFINLPKFGNDSNLLIVFYVQIMPDDFVMQLHR
ncbi:hypothetical protein MY532_15930, partial [Enterobacter hormaechei]|nr:hypothetical protein [Enterobacter hormaechei]MCQ4222359.1 hypothetical protein [Enterobacter hormaechei]